MSKVEDVIRFFRGIFHILGIWPIGEQKKWHRRGAMFVFFFCLIFSLVMCCLSLVQVKTVEEFSQALLHIIIFTYGTFIIITFCNNVPKTRKLLSEIHEAIEEDDDAKSFVEEASISALKISKSLWVCIVTSASIMMIVFPVVFGVLPFPMWTPGWIESTTSFRIYWIIELLCFIYYSQIINIFFFGFAIVIIINGYGQFLNVRLSMLVSTEDHDGYPDLVKCILAHQKFNKMVDDFKTIWGAIIGTFFKIIVFVIGACIFVITKGDEKPTFDKNAIFFMNIAVSVLNVFIPSYFGELIYSTSSQFSSDFFSSDWVYAEMKYKKAMIIVMENMKQPVKLSVLFYDSLNLKLFQDTVNEGYSMYSVFQNLKKKVNKT